MTTKEASDKFNLSEGTIRTLCKNGKILGVTKHNRCYVIPDDTAIIVKDSDVRVLLHRLLKYKNNPNSILSITSLDTTEKLES